MLLYPDPARWDEVVSKAMSQFRESCFLSRANPPGDAMVCLAATTLAETEENLIKARRIEGMKDVKLLVLKEMLEYTQWVDSMVDGKIAETSKSDA